MSSSNPALLPDRSRSRSPILESVAAELQDVASQRRITIGNMAADTIAILDVDASISVAELLKQVTAIIDKPLPLSRWRMIHGTCVLPISASLSQASIPHDAFLVLTELDNLRLVTASRDHTSKLWEIS